MFILEHGIGYLRGLRYVIWRGLQRHVQVAGENADAEVLKCWRGDLSGARCKRFAFGPADATATRHLLLH